MVSVVVVDNHPVVRKGLKALLESESDFRIVAEASDGLDALQAVEKYKPNIMVLELMIKGMNGIEVTRQLSKISPGTKIVVFSVLDSEHYVLEALRAGAKAYVLKESPAEELLVAFHKVIDGHRYLSLNLLDRTIDGYLQTVENGLSDLYHSLTSREKEVLLHSAQGKTSAQIADELFVSKRTIEAHRASMMRKLGLKKQRELVVYAIQKGLLPPEPETVQTARKWEAKPLEEFFPIGKLDYVRARS